MGGPSSNCRPILVVDDDAGVRALVVDALGRAGHEAVEASSGSSALELAAAQRPTLVILDVALPALSGYEVCRELREHFGAQLPILFVSGERTESHDRVAGLLLGGDDYLTKPFELDELLARVAALLRRAEPAGSAQTQLTPREHEVLCLLADALTQEEIAAHLVISARTVGTHIERILEKLGVHSRAQAVAVAYRDHLVGDPA